MEGTFTTTAVRWHRRVHVQRYVRLLVRLGQMTPQEVAVRSVGIPLRRWLTPARQAPGLSLMPRRQASLPGSFAAPLRTSLGRRLDDRFLFGPSFRHILDGGAWRDALQADRIVDLADRLGTTGLEILGQRIRLTPGEVRWQVDPRSGRDAWSSGLLDETSATRSQAADVKYVWEVNRHQYLTVLGRAFWYTDDPRYARLAVALVDDWIATNPCGLGVNWSSHLEVAMRVLSWLWTMPYLTAWPDLEDAFVRRWLASVEDHYLHLSRNLSVYTDPTNHLLGEATALWMLATVFPELPRASRQRARAMDVLASEVARQHTTDGINREQATSYQRFVLDFLVQILALARANREPLPAVLRQRTGAAIDFVAALLGPRGDVPMIGDSDDARGMPFPERSNWNFRDVLSTGAVLFARPDFLDLAGEVAEPTIWLLGQRASDDIHRLGRSGSRRRSRVFPGGYCSFKADTPAMSVDTFVDAGPLGLWPNAAHGHADALNLLIRLNGELLLSDQGTGTYFTDPAVRNWFRSTPAHNTVTVDGLDQADVLDVFKWVNPLNVTLLGSFAGEHFDYAAAAHDGYCRLRNPVMHHRHVLFVRPAVWVVVDWIDGVGSHVITRHFHFPPSAAVRETAAGGFVAASAKAGGGLHFGFAEHDRPGVRIVRDTNGRWSERYGHWQEAPRLCVEIEAEAPIALCTIISTFPGFDESRAARAIAVPAPLHHDSGQGVALWQHEDVTTGRTTVLFNPGRLSVPLPGHGTTDAVFACVARTEAGASPRTFLAQRDLQWGSGPRLQCHERVDVGGRP